jgi:DNA-binding CsgD family transcriptional regulator
MTARGGPLARDVIGREEEHAALSAFVDAIPAGTCSLVLHGEPGIGKTTLWEDGIQVAGSQGMRVLAARAGQAESQLSFTVLSDLLADVDDDVLAALPAPQRTALEVALLRRDPAGRPPEPRAISAGLLGALRLLSERGPLLVAIDDIQWLDAASAEAFHFAVRRLRAEPIGLLLTERSGAPSPLRDALDQASLAFMEVRPLSFGAVRRMLGERFGLVVSRQTLRRIIGATNGNPLFVLEIGRTLVERHTDELADELLLTGSVENLLVARVDGLEPPVRRSVLAVALSDEIRRDELRSIAPDGSLDDAVDAGLLVMDGERVRLFHPLLAAAVRSRTSARDQRAIHLDLAEASTDEARRARHLALASTQPDEELAEILSVAVSHAAERGARSDGVSLAKHALRLTPPDSPRRPERVLALGDMLVRVGEKPQLQSLLSAELEQLPAGPLRARGHLLMLGANPSVPEYLEHLERALDEGGADPLLRARALAAKAIDTAVFYVRRIPACEVWAQEAMVLSPTTIEPLAALGWARILGGRPVDDLIEREAAITTPEVHYSVHRLQGIRSAFRGEIELAGTLFRRLRKVADERGEDWSYASVQHQLAELALRRGDLAEARAFLADLQPGAEDTIATQTHAPRLRALMAAIAGVPEDTLTWAAEAQRRSATMDPNAGDANWDVLETRRATGIIALLTGDPAKAANELSRVWRHTEQEGIRDPGAFPVAPDLIEAHVALGDLDAARLVTARLSQLSEAQAHPWGRASVLRSRGLLELTLDAPGSSADLLASSAAAYAGLGLAFDAARSLLLQGRAERRLRRWGRARETLRRSAEAFDAIGSSGWASHARAELDRISDHQSRPPNALTLSERRVAELAAEGLSNREIAAALFVGEHTVEVHLSRTYSKLGIRSRAGLARRLAEKG